MALFSIFTDGGSRGNPGESAYGFVVRDQNNGLVAKSGGYLGTQTNNFAEYSALMQALMWAYDTKYWSPNAEIAVFSDSMVVVQQVLGTWQVKHENLRDLWVAVDYRLKLLRFEHMKFSITHIPREQNTESDAIVNEILDSRKG